MTLGNQSSSKLQMGSSRNRDPLTLSRDEDPSWDLEDPPKPRRKPSRTYSMLFIIKNLHKQSSHSPSFLGSIRILDSTSAVCHYLVGSFREGLRHGLGGSSKSQEGSSSLLSFRGSLFRLEPICSMEELWFLVVLDSDSYYPTPIV